MSNTVKTSDRTTRTLLLGFGLLLCTTIVYLLRCHYVKAYSDPTGWVGMAEGFWNHYHVSRWSVVFAMYLIAPLKLLGLQYTFISNLPWILVLVVLTYWTTSLCCRQDRGADQHLARQCGLAAAVALVFAGHMLFLELLNPYREVVAFTLLLGTFTCLVCYPLNEKSWLILLSGAIFGFGVGVREPNAIAAISLFYLYLGYLYKAQPRNGAKLPALFAAGGLIGLIPFFIQNHLYSGYWWIPNYLYEGLEPRLASLQANAGLILQAALLSLVALALLLFLLTVFLAGVDRRQPLSTRADQGQRYRGLIRYVGIAFTLLFFTGLFVVTRFDLVPGMYFERFSKVGPKTVRYIISDIGWFSCVCFFMGIIYAAVRRYYTLLLLCLPSLATYLYFWSFYGYVKPRYVFTIEVFMFPLIGVGFVGLASALATVLRFVSARTVRQTATLAAVLALSALLAMKAYRGMNGVKVWHLPAVREAFLENLEEPFMFDSVRNHHAQMLAIATGDSFSKRFAHNNAIFVLSREDRAHDDLDAVLHRTSQRLFARLQEGNLYCYGKPERMMVRLWLEGVPTFDMSTLDPPLKVYNDVMEDFLYKIAPWQEETYTTTLDVDGPGRYLLALDAYRLWDYTNRGYAQLSINDRQVVDRLSNHFQWAEVELDTAKARLAIESDVGIPSRPHIEIHAPNDRIKLDLGARKDMWYRNYLSSEFQHERLIHRKAAMLLDRGTIALPNFASRDHEVFAKFHYEFYQEHSYFRNQPHDMTIESGEDAVEVRLPPRNVSASATVSLGRGHDRLVMVPVQFESTLPSLSDQAKMRRNEITRGLAYVKLYTAEIWSAPAYIEEGFVLKADVKAEPYLDEGFYPAEKDRSGPFRWTAPEARLHLPKTRAPSGYTLVVETRDFRPDGFRHEPAFTFNEVDAIARKEETDDGARYVFDSLSWNTDAQNQFKISTQAWNPHADSGLGDTRDLGVVVTALRVERQR